MCRNDILLLVEILLTLALTENAEKTKTIDFKRSYLGRTEFCRYQYNNEQNIK